MSNKKKLTEMQEAFLEALADKDRNPACDPLVAKRLAGYSEKSSITHVTKPMRAEILEVTECYLAGHAMKGAKALVDVIDNPRKLGNQHLIAAAKDILDRVGVAKKEKMILESDSPTAILILPEKNKD